MHTLVGGSRSLPVGGLLAARWLGRCAARSGSLVVGCSLGADVAALSGAVCAGLAPRVSVFAVGGASGAGFSWLPAFGAVSGAALSGASVSWFAGGSSLPFRARLVRRSAAAAAVADLGFFVVSSPSSVGSLRCAAALAARGCPVVFCPFGFSGPVSPLPGLSGFWVPFAGVPVCSRAVLWVPSQISLF